MGSAKRRPKAAKTRNRHGEKGLRRRQEILAAARSELQVGSHHTILRRVAEGLEISLGNVQYYFPTREDLLETLFSAEADSDAALFASVCERAETPRDRLAAVTLAFISRWSHNSEASGHKSVWRVLRSLSLGSPRFQALRHQVWERFYGQLGSILRELTPGATESQVRLKAVLVTAMIDGTSLMPAETLASLHTQRSPSYEDAIVAAVLWIAEH